MDQPLGDLDVTYDSIGQLSPGSVVPITVRRENGSRIRIKLSEEDGKRLLEDLKEQAKQAEWDV